MAGMRAAIRDGRFADFYGETKGRLGARRGAGSRLMLTGRPLKGLVYFPML
jgi:hypothetical protein